MQVMFCWQVQNGVQDFSRFQRVVKMLAFHPFDSAENALDNMHALTEHELTEDLRVGDNIIVLLLPHSPHGY
jgi:nucleolar protein 56